MNNLFHLSRTGHINASLRFGMHITVKIGKRSWLHRI